MVGTTIEQLKGNLITMAELGQFDFIVHGCNCFHVMKSGIAGQIARKYVKVIQADQRTHYGSRDKLGTWTSAEVESTCGHKFTVVNAYTQYNYSRTKDVFDYGAFEKFLKDFSNFLICESVSRNQSLRVGFPKIGCGLAGGNEARIVGLLGQFSKGLAETPFETRVSVAIVAL